MAVKKKKKTITQTLTTQRATAEAGFCVYIGPTILGLIQTGTIYPGTRAEVLKTLVHVTEKYPEAASLVVTGDTLSEDRINVSTPGNYLYEQYRRMSRGKK